MKLLQYKKLKFFFDSGITFAGVVILTFFAYLYHFLMVRFLSPRDYGELSVLIGTFAIITFPATSIQSLLSTEVSRLHLKREEEKMTYFIFKHLGLFAFICSIPFFLSLIFIFLFKDAAVPYVLMLLGTIIIYLIAIPSAYFQGTENIVIASFIQGFIAFIRFIVSGIMVILGLGLFGAILAFPLSSLFVLSLLLIPFIGKKRIEKYSINFNYRIGYVFVTGMLFTIFMYLDLFATKLFIGAEAAGIYNAAAITARILYFLSSGLVLVFMPTSSKLSKKEPPGKRHLILLGKSAFMLLLPLLFFLAVPSQILSFFYTPQFSSPLVFSILSIGAFFFSLFFLSINIFWSYGDEKTPFLLSLLGVFLHFLILCFLGFYYPSIENFSLATLLSSITLFSLSFLFLFGYPKSLLGYHTSEF